MVIPGRASRVLEALAEIVAEQYVQQHRRAEKQSSKTRVGVHSDSLTKGSTHLEASARN